MIFKKLLPLIGVLLLPSSVLFAQTGRWEKELSDKNWSLWLDRAAVWNNDDIYLPSVNVASLPVNLPTCGWKNLHLNAELETVSVPGTVEEHYWGNIGGAVQDTNGNYVGVSWWSKKFYMDESLKGKRIILFFESVNLRAEIFVNNKLVGYDVIGNTPFEVNATDAIIFGQDNQLDIRITDPVGNFEWDDNILMRWGKNLIPAVHGFGGITGRVILRATDNVTVSDIYVQNQADPKKINIIVTLDNYSGNIQKGELSISIYEKNNQKNVVWNKTIPAFVTESSKKFTLSATVPQAKLWELTINKDIRSTNLYEAAVKFTSNDKRIIDDNTQRFGFRWFDVGEKDGDKRFYLNGKRVFIIAAMTRGFWPKNGIYPTSSMAKRDMNVMYDLGMNTMLMHRAIGQPGVFNYADSAGLFTYEEPGGFRVTPNRRDKIEGPDDQAYKLRREKLRRMIIRDRSFPSLVIYNLKNEERNVPNEYDIKDILMVHELDPSRIVTYNSGSFIGRKGKPYNAKVPDDSTELHMLPMNSSLIYTGWWDQHHWIGYSGYTDEMYRNPKFYLRGVINSPRVPLLSDSLYRLDKKKVIFFGEEGAFGTIVRLQKIKEEIEKTGSAGFREQEHLDWFNAYDRFLDETGFRKAYANVDSLTKSLGRNLHYFHGRNIESIRMGNIADAYNLNGWGSAATRTDVVDMYRNPTADASIIRHYTQPLYIAVKIRNKVVPVGSEPIVDFYIINELNLKGKHTLDIVFNNSDGKTILSKSFNVTIKGGEEFGQLLAENVKLSGINQQGYYMVKATLNAGGNKKADGFDDIYAVDISNNKTVSSAILVLENDDIIRNFLKKVKGVSIDPYSISSPETNMIIVGNYDSEKISPSVLNNIFERVKNGTRLIVLGNADKFAGKINEVLGNRPKIYNGGGIKNWGGEGRLFVGLSPALTGLPQAQGMSWEYQCFYKGPKMDEPARVTGISLNNRGSELIVALGNQGSKEILTALSRIRVGMGNITLSTLNMLPNLSNNEPAAIVAKKIFLNLLEY